MAFIVFSTLPEEKAFRPGAKISGRLSRLHGKRFFNRKDDAALADGMPIYSEA